MYMVCISESVRVNKLIWFDIIHCLLNAATAADAAARSSRSKHRSGHKNIYSTFIFMQITKKINPFYNIRSVTEEYCKYSKRYAYFAIARSFVRASLPSSSSVRVSTHSSNYMLFVVLIFVVKYP